MPDTTTDDAGQAAVSTTIEDGSTVADDAAVDGAQDLNGDESGGANSHNDDPYYGMSREQVIEQINTLKGEQSDREARATALNEKLTSVLEKIHGREEAQQESTVTQRSEARISEAHQKLKAQWADKLEEGGGEAVFEAMNAGFMDMLEIVRDEREAVLAELRGETNTRLQTLDPVYRANKVEVDKLAKELGIPTEKAIHGLRTMGKLKEPGRVSQPAKPKAPGRTTDRSAASGAPTPGASNLSAEDKAVLKASGLTDKDIAELVADMAKAEGA